MTLMMPEPSPNHPTMSVRPTRERCDGASNQQEIERVERKLGQKGQEEKETQRMEENYCIILQRPSDHPLSVPKQPHLPTRTLPRYSLPRFKPV